MSAALAAWDREIEAAESELRRTPANAPPSIVAGRHVSLGRTYADRGRLADALAEFDAAGRLAPTRADVQVLRGLVLQEQGTPAEAIEAFRRARALDPGNPVTAVLPVPSEAAISWKRECCAGGIRGARRSLPEAPAGEAPRLRRGKQEGPLAVHPSRPASRCRCRPAHSPAWRRTARRSGTSHTASSNARLPNSGRPRRATRSSPTRRQGQR